jgi:hypothetical protein
MRKATGGCGQGMPLILVVMGLLSIASPAFAQQSPTMEITSTNFVLYYTPPSEPVRVFRYTIRNASAPSPTNNLFAFNLPVGLDAGLVYTWFDQSPLDWQTWYGARDTEFGNTNTPIAPGSTATVEIRTTVLTTHFDYVTALAVGDYPLQLPSPGPRPSFTPVLVEVALGPSPPKLIGVTVVSDTVTLVAESLRWGYHYTLEQSATMMGWTNVADFWVTFENTNLTQTMSLPVSTGASGEFFRLRSP